MHIESLKESRLNSCPIFPTYFFTDISAASVSFAFLASPMFTEFLNICSPLTFELLHYQLFLDFSKEMY